MAHLALIPPIARRIHKFTPTSFELDDLIGEGQLGLIRAATRYRPHAHGGCPFSAFARPRIRGAILDSIRRRHFIEHTHLSIEINTPENDGAPLAATCPDARPLPDQVLDEDIRLQCLGNALAALPGAQRRILERWYGDGAAGGYKRAGWRRRRKVIALHEAAIANLKIEYRRAA